MSRSRQADLEARQRKEADALYWALSGDLESALLELGYQLRGVSLRLTEGDCLATLRVQSGDGPAISFVGSADGPGVFVKAVREARAGKLTFKPDQWALKKGKGG